MDVVPWICRIHAAWVLTASYWRCQSDRKLAQTIMGDGTEKRKTHIEAAVICTDRGQKVAVLPWFQADKAGKTTVRHTFEQSDHMQKAYKILFDKVTLTVEKFGLEMAVLDAMPQPAPDGHLLANLKNANNDHAGVECTRVNWLELAIRIMIGDEDFTLNRAKCAHHKLGLLAAKIQKACHNTMVEILGADTDVTIGEFKTSNMIDMFQRQLALLFDHHVGSYVFGNGVILFPRWFRHKYPGLKLHVMDRQVGNRHGVLLKNAIVHYTMFDAYREWCAYLQFEVKDENSLHFRCGSKLRCDEMKGAIRARAICYVKVCARMGEIHTYMIRTSM